MDWQEFSKEGRNFRVGFETTGRRILQERITPKRRVAYWRGVPAKLFPTKWLHERILHGVRKA